MTTTQPFLFGADSTARRGILLLNLGSPNSPAVADVRDYLLTFLMDRRIIGLSYPVRHLLVHRIIVPRRAPKSAANYRTIWDEATKSFPLIAHSRSIAEQLSALRQEPVAIGMRYGHPSTAEALQALTSLPHLEEIVIVPLYPHYARSSYETAVAFVLEEMRRLKLRPVRLRLQEPFYHDKAYRSALAESIRPYLSKPFDRLIVSMHGIPLSHIPKACREENGHTSYCRERRPWHELHGEDDCYRLQCEETRHFLAEDLGLPQEKVELAYQSRLGLHPWLQPYMSKRIRQLPHEGIERVLVVCPGFVCDCLETIQEIDAEYRHDFLSSGGKEFTYIPCLNSQPAFVSALSSLLDQTNASPSTLLSEENKRKYKY